MVHYGINLNPRHPVGQPANMLDLLAVRWARIVFKAAAASQSVEDAFKFYDVQINRYNQANMRTLMIVNQETFWGNGPWDNGDWDLYAREFGTVCGQIAAHYRGKGVAYEIWNEGDIKGPSSVYVPPDQFAKVLDAAASAIKAADPDALITFGGLASSAVQAAAYVKQTRSALNGRLPVDSISIHPYGQWTPNFDGKPAWGGWFGRLDEYLQTLVNAVPNIPFWITEIGISEEINFPPEQYPMVVKYMDGIYDLVTKRFAANIDLVVWFAWSDAMRQAGIVDGNNRPKTVIYKKFFDIARATQFNTGPKRLDTQQGIILKTTDGLSLRAEPNTNAARLTVITKDTEVTALEAPSAVVNKLGKTGQWLQLRTPSGLEGWSAAWFLEFSKVVVATTSDLNIRSGGGTQFDKIATVTKSTLLTAVDSLANSVAKIGQDGQWLQVRTADGKTGWAAAWFLTLGVVTEEPPEEEPPTRTLVYPTVNLNIRSGAGTGFEKVIMVTKNTPVLALENAQQVLAKIGKQDQWLNIETREGQAGWAAAWYMALKPTDAPQIILLTPTTNLNLRTGPGAEHARIMVMEPGTELTVLEDPQGALNTLGVSGWIKLKMPDGVIGWTSAKYLRRV